MGEHAELTDTVVSRAQDQTGDCGDVRQQLKLLRRVQYNLKDVVSFECATHRRPKNYHSQSADFTVSH